MVVNTHPSDHSHHVHMSVVLSFATIGGHDHISTRNIVCDSVLLSCSTGRPVSHTDVSNGTRGLARATRRRLGTVILLPQHHPGSCISDVALTVTSPVALHLDQSPFVCLRSRHGLGTDGFCGPGAKHEVTSLNFIFPMISAASQTTGVVRAKHFPSLEHERTEREARKILCVGFGLLNQNAVRLGSPCINPV